MSTQANINKVVDSAHCRQNMQKRQVVRAKRSRSPHTLPFVSDYRPYGGKQLQAAFMRRGNEENHKRQWDVYYRNNTINGYKDRHYILRQFHDLREAIEYAQTQYNLNKYKEDTLSALLPKVQQNKSFTSTNHSNRCNTDVNNSQQIKQQAPQKVSCTNNTNSKQLVLKPHTFTWLQAGCGVGNAFLPIFEQYGHLPQWHGMLGFDISSQAIRLLKIKQDKLPTAIANKMNVIVLDPTKQNIYSSSLFQHNHIHNNRHQLANSHSQKLQKQQENLQCQPCNQQHECCLQSSYQFKAITATYVSLIFVLCSMPTHTHLTVIDRIKQCMTQPGGVLFFRDYAVDDHAAVRFAKRQISPTYDNKEDDDSDNDNDNVNDGESTQMASSAQHTFRRCNGTLSHFFGEDEVRNLFTSAGFTVRELTVVERNVINRKTSVSLSRRFIQGRFVLQ